MKTFARALVFLFLVFTPFLLAGQFRMKTVSGAEDMPEGFCPHWEKGDILISDGLVHALVGGPGRATEYSPSHNTPFGPGCILGFAPAGVTGGSLHAGTPVLRVNGFPVNAVYTAVLPAASPAVGTVRISFSAEVKGPDDLSARVVTTYTFSPSLPGIEVVSTVSNTGDREFEDLSYSLYTYFDSRYNFSPFEREKHPRLNFRVCQKKDHALGWLDLTPLKPENGPLPGRLVPGEEFSVRNFLMTDREVAALLERIYAFLGVRAFRAEVIPRPLETNMIEVVVEDIFSRTVFFRTFRKGDGGLGIPLPQGVYSVEAHFFPAVVHGYLAIAPGGANTCTLEDLPSGILKAKIRTGGSQYVPGKVTILGLAPTSTPYFHPENPIETGRSWEERKNSCYPPEEGADIRLPVGTYLAVASRGPEYSRENRIVEVLEGKTRELVFHVDRVLEPEGLVSLDPHLHTTFSDGAVSVPERLRSVVAEGLDIAVASDHNFITDYGPALKKLGLQEYLTVLSGNEVTSSSIGIHYNTYPVSRREDEKNKGAVDPHRDLAAPLFLDSRAKDPEALLQLNHPRDGTLGYFNNWSLDPESAAWAREGIDFGFDIMEVLNGPWPGGNNAESVLDWIHLLNRGYYFPLVGSSDSHSLDGEEPGYSRTYVLYEGDRARGIDWKSVARALKAGRSFASNGPLVFLTVNERHTFGDTLTEESGKVVLRIKVLSVPWVGVDEVRVLVNGERTLTRPVSAAGDGEGKFDDEFELLLEKDSSLVVEVCGWSSLFPAVQSTALDDKEARAVLPYAITNPVFVDVDGNGRFDPPLPNTIERRKAMKANENP